MRLSLPRSLALATVMAIALPAGGAAAAGFRCSKARGTTVALTRAVRLYKVKHDSRTASWFACSMHTNFRKALLEEVVDTQDVVDYRVAGNRVALQLVYTGPDYVENAINVANVGKSGSHKIVDVEPHAAGGNPDSPAGFSSWVVHTNGAVAFITHYEDADHVVAAGVGKARMLDEAASGIAGSSLALAPNGTVYWSHDGQVRTASLK